VTPSPSVNRQLLKTGLDIRQRTGKQRTQARRHNDQTSMSRQLISLKHACNSVRQRRTPFPAVVG